MAHDVFISYSDKDKTIAKAVLAKLEERGLRCWVAWRDIIPGSNWALSIAKAIDESRAMVLIFSSEANQSPHVEREAERAVHNKIPIVPFRIEDVEPTKGLGYFIGAQHWLDAMTPPLEQHIFTLADALKLLLGESKGETGPSTKPSLQAPLGKLRRDGFNLRQNKRVLFSVILIVVALLGAGLYASGLLTGSSLTTASTATAHHDIVTWGNGTLTTAENAQVKVTTQYQGNYTGGPEVKGIKSIQFLVFMENKAYTGSIFGNPYNFLLYTSDKQLLKPATASFGSSGLHTVNGSKPGDTIKGILVFQMAEGTSPVELRYDDVRSTPLVLPVVIP